MNWERTVERYPELIQDNGTSPDPFYHLFCLTQTSPNSKLHSELEYNVHRSLELQGGWVKCSVSVRIVCPQDERSIDQAGEVSFLKADELMNDGLSIMIAREQQG